MAVPVVSTVRYPVPLSLAARHAPRNRRNPTAPFSSRPRRWHSQRRRNPENPPFPTRGNSFLFPPAAPSATRREHAYGAQRAVKGQLSRGARRHRHSTYPDGADGASPPLCCCRRRRRVVPCREAAGPAVSLDPSVRCCDRRRCGVSVTVCGPVEAPSSAERRLRREQQSPPTDPHHAQPVGGDFLRCLWRLLVAWSEDQKRLLPTGEVSGSCGKDSGWSTSDWHVARAGFGYSHGQRVPVGAQVGDARPVNLVARTLHSLLTSQVVAQSLKSHRVGIGVQQQNKKLSTFFLKNRFPGNETLSSA